jgi:hypothetical protein
MTKTIAIATALLLGTDSFAFAQKSGGTTSPGASQYSPGHEMQNSKTNTGQALPSSAPATVCTTRVRLNNQWARRNFRRATA